MIVLKIIAIMIILLCLPFVNALDYLNSCDDNETLRKTMTFQACESSNCTTYNFTQLLNCKFGCDNISTHQCNPSPYSWNLNFLIIFGVILIALIFLFIIKRK